MYKIYSLAVGLCVSLMTLVACSPKENTPHLPQLPELELSDTVIIVDASARVVELNLNTVDATEWSVSGGVPWCTVSPMSGKEASAVLKFSINANTLYDDLTYTWKVTASNPQALLQKSVVKHVKVVQRALGAILISEKEIAVDYNVKEVKVAVASNVDVNSTVVEGGGWLEISEKQATKALVKDTIYLALDQNPNLTERVARLRLSDATGTLAPQEVVITQGPSPDPAKTPRFLSFDFVKVDNPKLSADISATSISAAYVEDTIRFAVSGILPTLNLKARFTHTGGAVKIDGKEIESSKTLIDFAKINKFSIDNGAGIVKDYVVVVYQKTGIPVVYIDTEGETPIVSKDDYVKGQVCFAENSVGGASSVLNVPMTVKGRGNSTWGMPKKPYKIKLNSKASVFGFPADKEWVLLANYVDPSLLKNTLAFEISSRVGLAYSPRKINVEVVVNGKHGGSYLLTEQIKISSNRVNVKDLSDADLSGGYLLELDTYYDETWKFKSSKYNLPVMVKEPDVEQKHIDYLSGYFTEMENVIDGASFTDPVNGYAKYIDADSWINWWIVYEVMGNWEPNHPKSTYVTKDAGGKLTLGPIWDFDWNEFNMKTDRFYMTQDGTASSAVMPLYFKRLLSDPAFAKKLKDRYAELRKGVLSDDQITAYLKTFKSSLQISAGFNHTLWEQGASVYTTEFDKLLNFTINHMRWLDVNIPKL